jgi:polysaccharide export outer membrane protein
MNIAVETPSRTIRTLAAGLVALVLSGCTVIPGQGPSTHQVVEGGQQAQPIGDTGDYVVVDLNEHVVRALMSRSRTSFFGSFGDRRPPQAQAIGVGDSISVTIWEAAAGGLFSSPVLDRASPGAKSVVIPDQIVSRDGSITVPYAGRIRVVGATPPMVEQRIVAALAGKAIEPQALVTVTRNLSNTASVLGEVNSGARVPLSPRGDRVLDVIASAGGIRSPVHETFISLSRDGRAVKVPMQVVMQSPQENIFVRSGDTLTLVRAPQTFTAFGATGRQAAVPFDAKGITLEEGVAKAGGLLELQADPQGVFLLRDEPVEVALRIDPNVRIGPGQHSVRVVYRLNMRDTNTFFLARQVPVIDKDILYVATAPLNDIQKAMVLVQSAASAANNIRNLARP